MKSKFITYLDLKLFFGFFVSWTAGLHRLKISHPKEGQNRLLLVIQVFLQPGSFPMLLHLVLSGGAPSPKSISISTNYTEPKQSLDKCTGYLKLPSSPQVPYLNRCLNCRCRVCVLSRGIYIWEFKVVSGFFTLNRNFKLINTSKISQVLKCVLSDLHE